MFSHKNLKLGVFYIKCYERIFYQYLFKGFPFSVLKIFGRKIIFSLDENSKMKFDRSDMQKQGIQIDRMHDFLQ